MATNLVTIAQRTLTLFSQLGWQSRTCDLDNDIEIRPGPNAEWERITKSLEAYFRTEARKNGISEVNAAYDAFYSSARQVRYHPIKDFLNGLTYDGGHYIQQLANHFDNPDGMFEQFLRRWLIASVRRVIEGGTQNRMLVLDGPQNSGKSSFVRWLVPNHLQRSHFVESPIRPDDEDHKRRLLKTWVWEVAELGATTRRSDVEALKHFLSLQQVTVRLKYDRGDTEKPSLTSFIGTINNVSGALNDPTGSRRFMFCTIKHIDWAYSHDLSPDQIWSEAYMQYLAGESADLTSDEADKANLINKAYQADNYVRDLIFQYFEIDPTNQTWFSWTIDIETILQNPPNPSGQSIPMYKGSQDKLRKEISAVLLELGCQKGDRRKPGNNTPQKGYFGIKVK